MRRIHKVQLMPETRQVVMMDPEAEVVSLGVQVEHPVMYFSTPWPSIAKPVERVFRIMTTGDEYNPEGKRFVGTVTLKDWYVAHVFEYTSKAPDPIDHRHDQDLIDLRNELDKPAA